MVSEEKLDTLRDFKKFAEKFLVIRTKSGRPEPFKFNRAQTYLHGRLEAQRLATGKVRAVILKGRQQGCCFGLGMKVLTADYRWKKIEDIEVGERLVACDEHYIGKTKSGRSQSRKLRTAIVEAKEEFYKKTYEILFDNGAKLNVTPEHRMLCKKRGGDDQQWREVKDFRIGDLVRVLTRPPNYECQQHEDGWLAGMIDGEGSARLKGAKRISIHQVPGPILNRVKDYFKEIGVPYKEVIDNRKAGSSSKFGNKPVHRIDIHRLPYLIEMFARCRPTRFTRDEWHVGHEIPGKAAQDGIRPWASVVSITPLKKQKVIDLQTSEKTYICEGLVSHNSTLIQGRFFHKVVTTKGKKAFILTHDKEATKNLFTMAVRFNENIEPGLIPVPDTENAKELYYRELDSGYSVGTAGNKSVGRSQTIQLFHGSEVGFWSYAEDHAKGILQAVSDEPGTEIILESTANGIGNYFHSRWNNAMGGASEYQAIFLPWYWQEEYTSSDDGFIRNEEEEYLYKLYSQDGLTNQHLAWRRNKISGLSKDYEAGLEQFKQEYPFSATEAFLNPIQNVFINARYVTKARKADITGTGPLIIGVDVAISNQDRTAIIRRKGRLLYNLEKLANHNTMEICGRLKRIIQEEKPVKVYIDCIGVGAGVVDRMQEMGFDMVEGVNVARSANDKEKFKNLRAELWSDMRDWLYQEMPVQVPDSDELHGEFCCLGFKYDSAGRLQIESKDDLRARGMPSPDGADAACLTMYGGFYGDQHHAIEVPVIPVYERGMFR